MTLQQSLCPGCKSIVQYELTDTNVTCPSCQLQFRGVSDPSSQPLATTSPIPSDTPVHQEPSVSTSPPPTLPDNRTRLLAFIFLGMVALAFAGLVVGGVSLYLLLAPAGKTPQTANIVSSSAPNRVPAKPTPRPEPQTSRTQPVPSPATNDSQPGAPLGTDTPGVKNAAPMPVKQSPQLEPAKPAPKVATKKPATSSLSNLAYRWKTGEEHAYKISIETEEGGRKKTIDGWCNFTVGEAALQGFQEAAEATGTAFVVTSDGYLITCAHVVEDASTIEVTLNETRYEASVVDTNHIQDLALLRIDATELQPIALANSEEVQQGETIHAVGYPLSGLLGAGVKVTQGTLAGVIQEEHGTRFQVDVSINPGNSGGPIVDSTGNVVGIASSKLLGVDVTSVGFAIPSSVATAFLARNQVKRFPQLATAELNGPQLVTTVKPSIALVTAKYGESARKRFKIRYEGGYTHAVPMSQSIGPRFRFGGPGRSRTFVNKTERAQGTLRTTRFGEIDQFTGETQFPYVLGHVGKFFLEDLNHHHDQRWGSETQTELQIIERANSNFPFTPPFGPRGPFGPSQPRDKVKESHPAVERTRYNLVSEDENQFVLKKQYEFRTLEDEESPYIHIRGSGEVIVDKSIGMPTSLTYDATLVQNQKNVTVRLPLRVTYKLRDPAEVAAERKKNAELAAQRKAEAEKKRKTQEEAAQVAATVPNPEKVVELMANIAAKPVGEHWHYKTIDALAKLAVVEEQREDVVKLAQERMSSTDSWVSNSATVLLIKWGKREDHVKVFAPYLSDIHNGVNHWILGTVYGKLGEYDDPQIIAALVTRLKKREDAGHAQKALIAIGSPCEDALLMAMEMDSKIHKHAAGILKQVGTEKCLAGLERAELDSKDTFARRDIRAAREAIQSRLKDQ